MKGECGSEVGIGIVDMCEKEVGGLEWVRCEEEVADGEPAEAVGAFKDGGASLTTTGGAVANEEAGDVA